ncbi:MAG TPA: hypothetical protein VFC78_05930 [Tepidisphaeraceae bacterium]|nr:hypothetical protein [Tepidisphaeraceae bacterium]
MKHTALFLSCMAALSVPLAWAAVPGAPPTGLGELAPAATQPAPSPRPLPLPGAGQPAESAAVDADEQGEALGDIYESQSAGVSFRPPARLRLSNTPSSKYIAEWTDPARGWTLALGKMVLNNPAPLISTKDNFGKDVEGILERTIKNLQIALPGSRILRQDVTNTRDGGAVDPIHPDRVLPNVGLIAIRYTTQGKRRLSQQAIVQANEDLYYLLTLTTPGSNAAIKDAARNDPGEAVAADVFGKMLDSVRLLDRSAIKKDQDNRLYRTRSLLVNFTPRRLHAALISEQWVRIIKAGKDVGYSYITEEQAAAIPRPLTSREMQEGKREIDLVKTGDGILIGVRARMLTQGLRSDHSRGPIQVDSASWFFVTADKKHENFSRIVVSDDHIRSQKGHIEEFGISERRLRRTFIKPPIDPNGGVIQPDRDPIPTMKDDYELEVDQTSGIGTAEQIKRSLPPFYLPQAISHLLPRLLPLKQPRGYLIATYVADAREVMMRYVDVQPEQDVTFAGQNIRAIPIQDRLGLEGSITMHYMSPDGVYLGSENKDQKLVMLPTDAGTLQHIWANANLTRPGAVKRPPAERPSIVGGAPAIPSVLPPGR